MAVFVQHGVPALVVEGHLLYKNVWCLTTNEYTVLYGLTSFIGLGSYLLDNPLR